MLDDDLATDDRGVRPADLTRTSPFQTPLRVLPLGTGLDGAVGYPMLSFYLTGAEIKRALELIVIVYPA